MRLHSQLRHFLQPFVGSRLIDVNQDAAIIDLNKLRRLAILADDGVRTFDRKQGAQFGKQGMADQNRVAAFALKSRNGDGCVRRLEPRGERGHDFSGDGGMIDEAQHDGVRSVGGKGFEVRLAARRFGRCA